MNCTNFTYVAELTGKYDYVKQRNCLGLSFGKLNFKTRLQILESNLNIVFCTKGTKLDYSISLISIKQLKDAIPDCVLY